MEARLTNIDLDEALRYAGCRGAPDPALRAEAAKCAETLLRACRPRLVWRLFPLSPAPEGLLLEGSELCLTGRDIAAHLAGCGQAVLLAATLGAESETLLLRAQRRDMAEALLLDACAGAAIENVCDNFCADLSDNVAPLRLTARFSPGYGDLPLSLQRGVLDALNAHRRIGLSLTDSGLMLPQKSVTAVIGLSAEAGAPAAGHHCEGCSMYGRCPYQRKDMIL